MFGTLCKFRWLISCRVLISAQKTKFLITRCKRNKYLQLFGLEVEYMSFWRHSNDQFPTRIKKKLKKKGKRRKYSVDSGRAKLVLFKIFRTAMTADVQKCLLLLLVGYGHLCSLQVANGSWKTGFPSGLTPSHWRRPLHLSIPQFWSLAC